jgi:hypothetical protein
LFPRQARGQRRASAFPGKLDRMLSLAA